MHYERVVDKIIIQHSRISAISFIFFFFVIVLVWQWNIFGMPKNVQELAALDKGFVGEIGLNSVFYLVACLPLFFSPFLVKHFRVAFIGGNIVIDGTRRKIFRNGKELLHFSEIQNLDFKHMEDSSIRLEFILHNGKKVKLGAIGTIKNVKTCKADILDVVQFSAKTLDEMPRKDSVGKVFAVIHYIVLAISILLLVGSLYAISSSLLFSLFGTTTVGKVIDIEVETIERIEESGRVGRPKKKVRTRSTVYTATIEYQDADGNSHIFQTSAVETGGNVLVVYLKFWPQFATVKSFSGMWGAFVILFFFGLILLFVSQMFNEKFFDKMKKRKERRESGRVSPIQKQPNRPQL